MALKFFKKGKGPAKKARKVRPKPRPKVKRKPKPKRKSRPKPKRRPKPKKKPRKVAVKMPKRAKKARPKRKPKARVPKKPALPPVKKIPDEKAYEMIKRARIPVVPYMFIKSEKDLPRAFRKLGFPLILKVSGRSIIHKTEMGGVKTASDEASALAAFSELMKIRGAEKVILQKKLSGLELIVGAKASPQFGYVVSLGIGGIYVEILKDVTFRVVPLTAQNAANMVKELKGYGILAGARGQAPIKFEALYDILMKVGRLATREKLKEMDINPLFCNKEGCWAADVRIVK